MIIHFFRVRSFHIVIINLVHNVAVVTGFARVGKVRNPLSVVKGVKTECKEDKKQNKKKTEKSVFTLFQATSLNLVFEKVARQNYTQVNLKKV